jgi:hypothetical protein
MFPIRFQSSNRNVDADQSSLQSERLPSYASNITMAPTYTGAHGLDDVLGAWSANVPNSSVLGLADTIGVVETSAAATSAAAAPRYSKCLSQVYSSLASYMTGYGYLILSILPDLCRGRSDPFEDICYSRRPFPRTYQSQICAPSTYRELGETLP